MGTATLWSVSTSAEMNSVSNDKTVDMCGDEMQGFEECGKIQAIRFFTVTALLLSLAAGLILCICFFAPPKLSAVMRRRMFLIGICHAVVVLVWNFLSLCIAGSVQMSEEYELNGAGFVSVILEFLLVGVAVMLSVLSATRWSRNGEVSKVAEIPDSDKIGKPQSTNSVVAPTLLTEGASSKKEHDVESSDLPQSVKNAWGAASA